MRNKLLFTAAMICMEMTPFGRVCTSAQAADDVGTADNAYGAYDTYGIPDGVVNAVYDSNGTLSGEQKSGKLPSGSGGDNSFVANGESRTVQPDKTIFVIQPGDGEIKGQTTDTLNAQGGSVNLDKYLLQVTNSGSDTSFSGSITGTTSKDSAGLPDVRTSGGLDVDARDPVTGANNNGNTNSLTLTGTNNYDGYTFVRGNSALILRDGGSINSQGVTEVGVGSDDSATMIVGKGGSLNLDGHASGDTPNSTIGALYVANNDTSLASGRQPAVENNNRLIVQDGGQVNARTVSVANRLGDGTGGIIYVTGEDDKGNRSNLKVGDGGLTINGGNGTVLVDRGGRVESDGVISLGDALGGTGALVTGNTSSSEFGYQGVQGKLIVGSGGTLVAGDAKATMYADTASGTKAWDYGLTDGITQNFGQGSNPASLSYDNGKSTFSISDGQLANRTNADGSGQALHTNMDIAVGGKAATFEVSDASTAAADPLAPNKTSKTGITIGGDIKGSGGVTVQGAPKADGSGYNSGTVALLGSNEYTGQTTVRNNGTLQLGGVMGDSTAYGVRIADRTFSTDGKVVTTKSSILKKLLDNGYTMEELLYNERSKEAVASALKQGFDRYTATSDYQSKVQDAYLNAGVLSSSSNVSLETTGKLNLAWGLSEDYVSERKLTAEQNSQTIANQISGYGQIVRDLQDGNDADSAVGSQTLNDVTSTIHLTGQTNLGRAADDNSSTPALLVRKGYLSVDNGGSVNITGNRNIVVGSDQGGDNNQLQVKNNGSIVSDGNMVIAANAHSQGNVVVGDYNAQSTDTVARLDLVGTGQYGNLAVGKDGVGFLSVQKGGEVSANSVDIGGEAGSTLNVGFRNGANVSTAGGILNVGQGGLTVGSGSTGTPTNSSYTAGVTHGGVIRNDGVTRIEPAGLLKVGEQGDDWSKDSDAASMRGTLVAGDVKQADGTTQAGIVNKGTGALTLALYANGVIQNRAGSDLQITGNPISLSDNYSQYGHHGTFDTNGQTTYVEANLQDYGKSVPGGLTGGLTKDGQGTLYLESHDNSYTGETEVKEGTLAIAAPKSGTMQKDAKGNDLGYNSSNASSSRMLVDAGATLTGFTSTDSSKDSNYGAAAVTEAEAGGTVEANWNNSYGALNIGAYRSSDYSGTQALTMDNGSTLSVGAGSTDTGNKITLAENTQGYDRSASNTNAYGIDSTGSALKELSYRQLGSGVVNVNGTTELNSATLNVQLNDNAHVYDGDGFRILTSTGAVSANHDNALTGALTTLPYVTPYLVFENNAVDVVMERNNKSFGFVGNTRNERETGHGLDGLPSNSAVAHAMTGMNSTVEARRSLNNLSGEIHASARSALIQDSYLLEQGMVDRMEDFGCDGDDRISSHGRYDLHTHRKESRCYDDHAILWGQAYGSMGHNAGDGNASMLHHQTTGFIMGIDTPVDDRWRVGGMLAYGRSMFNSGGATNSSGNSNNISIGTYAGRHWGRLNLRLGGFYTWNLMNMRRRVQVGDFGGRQTSHYRNGTARVFGELGYKMNFQKVDFEPFAGLSYVNQYGGSFREHGVAALYSKGQDDGVLFSSFGFRASRNFRLGGMWLRAHAMGAYRHAFGGIVSSRQQTLAGSTTDMSIGGVPLSRDSAIVKTGLSAKLSDRIDVDLSYIGQYGNQSIENGATGSVRFGF